MKQRHLVIALLSSFISLICLAQEKKTPINYGNNPQAGNYYNNNGVRIYYEVYGEGKPVVLLHGNGGSIRGRAAFIE